MPIVITEEYVKFLMDQIAYLTKLVETLTAQNEALEQTVSSLNTTIEQLNATIKELEEKKNKNSRNSSKPPSEKGAQDYLDIMSYVNTAKKLGSNAYEAIKNAVIGTPDYIFAGGC